MTPEDETNYLVYLNAANDYAFNMVFDSDRLKTQQKLYFLDGEFSTKLPVNYCFGFFNGEDLLKKYELKNNRVQFIPFSNEPNVYKILDDTLYISSSTRVQLTELDDFRYLHQRYILADIAPIKKELALNVTDPDTETDILIYPSTQAAAVWTGAVYFALLANNGFMEKVAYVKKLWDDALNDLKQYYRNDL